jgi:hypothetical protein
MRPPSHTAPGQAAAVTAVLALLLALFTVLTPGGPLPRTPVPAAADQATAAGRRRLHPLEGRRPPGAEL